MIYSLFLTLAQAAPQGTPAVGGPAGLLASPLVPFILIAVIFYFLIIRPQQQRQKEQASLIASVKTGDSVVMNSGIHGIVANVKEKTLIVKVADNVKIEFDRAAVAAIERATAQE